MKEFKKYRVRLYYTTFVDVEVVAEDRYQAYGYADQIACDDKNENITNQLKENMVQSEHDITEL